MWQEREREGGGERVDGGAATVTSIITLLFYGIYFAFSFLLAHLRTLMCFFWSYFGVGVDTSYSFPKH